VRLIGRSRPEDIVDCSIDIIQTGRVISATTIGQAAKILLAPYSIGLSMPDGDATLPGPVQNMAAYPGYTGYFLLEEMVRSVGMLVWDDANGNLVISKGGTGANGIKRAGAAIVEGQNAERVDGLFSADQRFARYYVLGTGADQINGHINAAATGHDPEAGVLRGRLRVIPQEIPDKDQQFSQQRADWEANRRWGRSRLVRVLVTGWRDGPGGAGGQLWTPNTIVSVQLPNAKVTEDRCLAEVTWMRGEQGTQALLTLMPAQALQLQPFAIGPITPQ
jgi:prophage tail gpP-like protein